MKDRSTDEKTKKWESIVIETHKRLFFQKKEPKISWFAGFDRKRIAKQGAGDKKKQKKNTLEQYPIESLILEIDLSHKTKEHIKSKEVHQSINHAIHVPQKQKC